MASLRTSFIFASFIVVTAIVPAGAAEKVKVATSFLGLWDTSQPYFCKERGEFEKAGLDVEVTSTRGGSENVQAVLSGGMDIAYSPGTNAVLAAYMQGAKIKIVGAQFTGQGGAFFYVPTDSPIKTVDDLNGKTIAFPRPGGAMEALLLGLKNERHLDIKSAATGAIDATYTMVMTKQVDVGYSFPPSLMDLVESKKIRVLFVGNDIESMRRLTGRVNIVSSDFLKNRRAVAVKFFEVLDRCIDWAYANLPEATKMYADINKIDFPIASRSVALYTREQMRFGPVSELDVTIAQAIKDKFISQPLTPAQIADLVDVIYTTPK